MRDDKVYLQDIVESINIIQQHIGDKTEFEFSKEVLLQDAVIRRFEIIGEAAMKVSKAFKQSHPEIEWQLMVDMRNKLIHEYFGLSASTIYQTIHKDLPLLKQKLVSLF
ncbi:MAG: DUF86 domain-containing protein [Bacteroidia bacterium]|nr:DUF86 domain-containing protein [Bacteroidia bacterium]